MPAFLQAFEHVNFYVQDRAKWDLGRFTLRHFPELRRDGWMRQRQSMSVT